MFAFGRVIAASALLPWFAAMAPASSLCAEKPVDAEELRIAKQYAAQKWAAAMPLALPGNPREQATRESPHSIGWGHSVAGIVGEALFDANPGREPEVLAYLNQVLIPEMHALRNEYVCGYTRLYYGESMMLAVWDGIDDPFQAAEYFVAPTRDYLREHDLHLTPRVEGYLQKYARFSRGGSFWQGIAASRGHIPCDGGAEVNSDSFEVQP